MRNISSLQDNLNDIKYMDRSKQLGEEKVLSLLVKFSIPAIIGMIVNALYNIVDRIFVGRGVGPLGVAGIYIGYPLVFIAMAFSMLVGIGGASSISIYLGEKQKDKAEQVLANGTVLLVFIGIILSLLGYIFMNDLLLLLGASEDVMPYASDYLRIIIIGAPFQFIGFGLNNYIRAEGNPRIAMLSMIIGAVLNTILDPIFIFPLKMGIEGAALATIISQGVSALWVIGYFVFGKSLLKYKRINLKPNLNIIKRITTVGSAPFAMQIAASLLTVIVNRSLRKYGGDISISAMGVINSILMMILMPIFGINQGAQPIIGYNYGARQYDRVKQTLKYAALAATTVTVIGFVATRIFSRQLINLFNNDDLQLVEIGSEGIKIFMFMLPVVGFQIVSSNYFQAIGKPKYAMFLTLSRQVLLLIPAILILPRLFNLGLTGVWAAGPTADFGSFVLTGLFLIRELRALDKKHSEKITEPETSFN